MGLEIDAFLAGEGRSVVGRERSEICRARVPYEPRVRRVRRAAPCIYRVPIVPDDRSGFIGESGAITTAVSAPPSNRRDE